MNEDAVSVIQGRIDNLRRDIDLMQVRLAELISLRDVLKNGQTR